MALVGKKALISCLSVGVLGLLAMPLGLFKRDRDTMEAWNTLLAITTVALTFALVMRPQSSNASQFKALKSLDLQTWSCINPQSLDHLLEGGVAPPELMLAFRNEAGFSFVIDCRKHDNGLIATISSDLSHPGSFPEGGYSKLSHDDRTSLLRDVYNIYGNLDGYNTILAMYFIPAPVRRRHRIVFRSLKH